MQAFRDTYGITEEDESELYGIWLLAEEASIEGGRFGEMNQNLIYHLVLRGGVGTNGVRWCAANYACHLENRRESLRLTFVPI